MLLNDSPHTFKTLYGRVITVNASDGKREVIIVISITSPGSGYVLETTTKPNRFSLHSRERFPLTHRVPLLKMALQRDDRNEENWDGHNDDNKFFNKRRKF